MPTRHLSGRPSATCQKTIAEQSEAAAGIPAGAGRGPGDRPSLGSRERVLARSDRGRPQGQIGRGPHPVLSQISIAGDCSWNRGTFRAIGSSVRSRDHNRMTARLPPLLNTRCVKTPSGRTCKVLLYARSRTSSFDRNGEVILPPGNRAQPSLRPEKASTPLACLRPEDFAQTTISPPRPPSRRFKSGGRYAGRTTTT